MTDIPKDGYFGRGEKRPDNEEIYPFKIDTPSSVLDDLKRRLQSARIGHEQLEDVQDFEYGINVGTLQEWKKYWLEEYDWRRSEAILNSFQHYRTEIEGLNVHFIHSKPEKNYSRIIPLLLVHGWPGSVFEFYKIIPLLTNPIGNSEFAFEVIAPSIPGYGWSEQSHKKGFSQIPTARIFDKLMRRLKFEKYMAQGGDWGAVVVSLLARMYPENLFGIHVNMFSSGIKKPSLLRMLFGHYFPSRAFSQPQYANFNLKNLFKSLLKETGYMHIQATKPDTVGVALNDSPVGLLAYILEKFSTWTNPAFIELADGGLERKFTKDEILTNVMIYWINQNIVSSQRYYKEFFMDEAQKRLNKKYIDIPTAYADMPHELAVGKQPIEIVRSFYNVIQNTTFADGGHFAAFEVPDELAIDIINFAKKLFP